MSVSLTGRKCQLVMRVKRNIVVRRAPGNPREGRLVLANGVRRVALGKGGVAALKREGDGATPYGRFPIRQVLYRADRMKRPRTPFPVRAVRGDDGWCEDPADRNYNRLVRLSPNSSADRLNSGRPSLRFDSGAWTQRPPAGEGTRQRHLRASRASRLHADGGMHRAVAARFADAARGVAARFDDCGHSVDFVMPSLVRIHAFR